MVVVTEAVSSSSLLLRCWVPVIDLIAADNPRRMLTGLGLKRASWDGWNQAWSGRSTVDDKLNWFCYSQSAFTCTASSDSLNCLGVKDSAGLTGTHMHCVRTGRGMIEAHGTKDACKTEPQLKRPIPRIQVTAAEAVRQPTAANTLLLLERSGNGEWPPPRGNVKIAVSGFPTPYEDGAGYAKR